MKRSTRWILLVTAVALLAAVATVAWVAVGRWTTGVAQLAVTGKAQVKSGANSLAAQDTSAAISQFGAANRSFTSAAQSFGPGWVARAVGPVPWVGRQYTAAQALVHIGLDSSVAGVELAEALGEVRAASTTKNPMGRIGALLATGRTHTDVAFGSLSDAADRAAALSADGLTPQLASEVRSVQATLRGAAPLLDRTRTLLQLASYLVSGNHRIIVVSQDGAELRPNGGFIGTYGLVDVGPTGVRLEGYRDSSTLPDPPGHVPPPPGALQTNDFNFRNANWWIDFPTSARRMLQFWRVYRQPPADGIVAVDTVAMSYLLAALGPVRVPSYGETFTAENLLSRLLYLVEVNPRNPHARKGVVAALATALEQQLSVASSGELAMAALALGKAANSKHVQIYFTDPHAEAAVDALGWSGRVAPPIGTTDVVAVSNAMNLPGKVNIAMKKTIDYEVTLQADRSAETTLVLGYANTGPYPTVAKMPSVFRDWLRVYRAPGTVFPSTTPDGGKTVTMSEFGFPAEARMFTLLRGQSRTETLAARVPGALRADTTSTAAPGAAAHYRLYLVRQDDLKDVPTKVTVTAPPGWHVNGATARLTASGAPLPVTAQRDRARMAVPLSGDLVLEVLLASP